MDLIGYEKIPCPKCQNANFEVWIFGKREYHICENCAWCIELKDFLKD